MTRNLLTFLLAGGLMYTLVEKTPESKSTDNLILNTPIVCDTCKAINVSHIYKGNIESSDPYSEPQVKKEPPKQKIKKALASVPPTPKEDPVQEKEAVKEEKPVSAFKPLEVDITRNPGLRIKNLDRDELEEYMTRFYKFKNLEGKSLLELRRIWLAYAYDQFYWDVHNLTGFPVSVIYAYFIMEATYQGLESDLMAKYRNPGGIKYYGVGSKTKAFDDCTDRRGRRIKCDFAVFTTYREMVSGWSRIFNAKRYQACKSENNAADICECLYKSGYHTGNNWDNRAGISKAYWEVRKSFPTR